MEITIKAYQTGKHSRQTKDFLIKTSVEDLHSHLLDYLAQIDISVFEKPRNASVETAIFLVKKIMSRFLKRENQNFEFRLISEVHVKSELDKNGMLHPNSGRPQKGQVEQIVADVNNIIYLWFFVAATQGKLKSKSPWPPVEIQNQSNLLKSGILSSLNDLEILSIFCSTKDGLQRAKSFGLFTERFGSIVDQLCEVFTSYQSRVDGIYKPSASYVLREYVISGRWDRRTVDVELINQIKDELTILSKSAQYTITPIDEFLARLNLLSLNGEVITYENYLNFLNSIAGKNEILIKENRQRAAKSKFKSLIVNHDERLIRLNFKLGDEYPTKELGSLLFKDLIDDNLFFISRKEYKTSNQRLFERFEFNSESGESESYFQLLFDIQKDYITEQSLSKQKGTLKTLRASLSDLNEYLCDYLFKFSMEYKYEFLDCSGDNFLNTKLAIAFSDSLFINKLFEEDFGLTIKPTKYNDWLARKKNSQTVMGIKIRHAVSFFDYCEAVAGQMDIKFINPMMNTKVSSNGLEFKETTKEVFGYVEWIVWTELVNHSFDVLKAYYEKRVENGVGKDLQSVEQALASDKAFEFIKAHYKIDVSLTTEIVSNAIKRYQYQYDNIWSLRVNLDSSSFVSCLAAIVVMVNSGLRSHSATNLQFEGLIADRKDLFSAINVIADKVNPQGFVSHLPNDVVDKILSLRLILTKLYPSSFSKKREIEQTGANSLFIHGLFGSQSNCDEASVATVADFFFYLYNEVVEAANIKLGGKMISDIPLLMMPRSERRGTGFNYKNKVFSEDLYVLPLAVAKEIPAVLLEKSVVPALTIIQRPNRTVHSFRASLVTNLSLAGINPGLIKLLTGQEAMTVNHYTKATAENLKILETIGVLGLAKALIKEKKGVVDTKSIEEIQDFVKSGIASSSGGKTCSFGSIISVKELDKIYQKGSKHIAIHATHICPYNDQCPSYISEMFENNKDCAICPVSISFVKDLPAITLKIKYHIDEAKHYQALAKSGVPSYQEKEFRGAWIKHSREVSMWLARYDLLSQNGQSVAGARIMKDSKDALLEFRCEDNHVLNRVLEILEAKGHYQYQSEDLKATAWMIYLKLGGELGSIDTRQFNVNPVESVSRLIEKIMDVNQISLEDMITYLNTEVDKSQLISTNKVMLPFNYE